MKKMGRKAPCPCGSGKKYKKCCLMKDEEKSLPERESPLIDDETIEGDFEKGDYSLVTGYKKLKSTDEKLEYVRNILMKNDELPTDFALDIFSSFSDSLGSEDRHSEAVETFRTFHEKKYESYLDAFDFFDKMLLYHYIHSNDITGIQTILKMFDSEPDKHIDNYVEILTALECYGYWELALSSYSLRGHNGMDSR
jgi:hypothetical protein